MRSMAWVLGRQVSLGGCWRMGAAAFMSASVVLDLGIGGYVMRWIPWPALAAVLVIWRHRSNIERLLAGTEPRLGQKKAESEAQAEPG